MTPNNTTSVSSAAESDQRSKQDCSTRFVMLVEIHELDTFAAPDRSWIANSVSLSRSQLIVMSRRMTFVDRSVMVKIKLASGAFASLSGKVVECSYHGRSLHRTVIALTKAPIEDASVR